MSARARRRRDIVQTISAHVVQMSETAVDRQLTDLNIILDVSRQLGATTELTPLLQKITRAVVEVLKCERATVFLHDPATDELYAKVATGEETIRFPAKLGIAGEAFKYGAPINVRDAYSDPRFNPAIDKKTGYKTRNLLTFPMRGHLGESVGVLQALNKHDGAFDEPDEERATDLGMLAGIAIQRQMLLDEYAEKQRLQRDLSLARDIQQKLLPKESPTASGYDIAGWNKPADDTGGDCFDYVTFDDGRIGVLLADVTGHGIGPALIAAECRALVRALASVSSCPSKILTQANRLICEDLDSGRFVTTFFGVLDPKRHVVDYLSAGHGPLLHYVAKTGVCEELSATTFPMGIVDEIDETPGEPIQLALGDMMILVTDGFFEWADESGALFGTERLAKVIHESREAPSAEIIQNMRRAVTRFGGRVPQSDDLTAVILKRLEVLAPE
jgi:phosphoserine phosphatase